MRARTLTAVLLAAATLSACSGSDGSSSGLPAGHGGTTTADPAAVGWSPCDGLTAASVSGLVGAAVQEENGTADSPRCTFTPVREGGAAYDVSYLYFDGGLDAALDAMGATGAQLKAVDVEGAEAARLVVDPRRAGILVTGFVQTDGLVQSVNAAQLAPFDRKEVVAGTRGLLAELAQHAPTTPSE